MDPQTQSYVNALSTGGQPGKAYWPDQSDLVMSKKYDTLYGSPWAPEATPGNAQAFKAPLASINEWYQREPMRVPRDVQGPLNTEEDADRTRTQAIAAERSAMSKLGFNPSLTVSTPTSGRERGPVNGLYRPMSNVTWYDESTPNAAMHESMHRAFDMLGKAGKLPKGVNRSEEELLVRALMQRAYGDVEVQQDINRGGRVNPESPGYKQVLEGKKRANDPIIDQIEAAAAQEVARRHPGGPR